jgi:putative heme iron utilization protein
MEWTAMNPKENSVSASALKQVQDIIASARQGTLASLMAGTGVPYASLVNVASLEGTPILLLSQLAWHTKNILADARGCLLLCGSLPAKDPLAGPRVSLMGEIGASNDPRAREIYLSQHPNARSYADFADFRFFRLNVQTAHYVAGFGQIITIEMPKYAPASR